MSRGRRTAGPPPPPQCHVSHARAHERCEATRASAGSPAGPAHTSHSRLPRPGRGTRAHDSPAPRSRRPGAQPDAPAVERDDPALHQPLVGRLGFYPLANTLTFSDPRLGGSLLSTPIFWVTGSAIAGYNVVFILSYACSALAAHALVRRLTRSDAAGFVAGCAYGFAPFRSAHLAHLELLLAWWMPLTLLAAHAWLESRSRRALALLALTVAAQGLFTAYYLPMLGLLLALWALWFAAGRVPARQFAELAGAAMLGVAALAPLLLHYWRVHEGLGLYRRHRRYPALQRRHLEHLVGGPGRAALALLHTGERRAISVPGPHDRSAHPLVCLHAPCGRRSRTVRHHAAHPRVCRGRRCRFRPRVRHSRPMADGRGGCGPSGRVELSQAAVRRDRGADRRRPAEWTRARGGSHAEHLRVLCPRRRRHVPALPWSGADPVRRPRPLQGAVLVADARTRVRGLAPRAGTVRHDHGARTFRHGRPRLASAHGSTVHAAHPLPDDCGGGHHRGGRVGVAADSSGGTAAHRLAGPVRRAPPPRAANG